MAYLYESLQEYCKGDFYPFHMPGHKRRLGELANPYSFDITEIEGFDNLHHAEGILLEAQKRAGTLYGAEETFYLVNGSTCGILSAIGACTNGGKLLMARNSHKAAYHAVWINRLEAAYLYPSSYCGNSKAGAENIGSSWDRVHLENGDHLEGREHINKRQDFENGLSDSDELLGEINGPVTVEEVGRALDENPDASAVFVTSPTYDGVVSDIRGIAALVHAKGIPLIVDEAHGAHFGMHPAFPESAVAQGADIVIHSVHKTLPSLTQTALLHVSGKLVDRRRLKRLLAVYQSSSPSYVLMSSIDQCVRLLQEQGKQLFAEFTEALEEFWQSVSELEVFQVLHTDDPSRILIFGKRAGLSGVEIFRRLQEDYHLELELAAGGYALALTAVGDGREGLQRLSRALYEMEKDWEAGSPKNSAILSGGIQEKNEICFTIAQAETAPQERIPFEKADGRIMGEYIYLYPPGIPLAVPGERLGHKLFERLEECRRMGFDLQGPEDFSLSNLWVIQEDV